MRRRTLFKHASASRGGPRGSSRGEGRGGSRGGEGRGGFKGRDSKEPRRSFSRRPVKFQLPKETIIDYKEIALLQKFTTDRGKILSRRFTGVSAKNQREIVKAIKQARFLGLLPILGALK